MRVDKTLSELWNLADDGEVGETARMAIKAIQDLQKENTRLNQLIGRYAGRMSDISTKQQELSKEINSLTKEFFTS